MDLVPKPDQLIAAAGNLAQSLVRGGFADLTPMPRTPVGSGPGHEVYRYDPAVEATPGDASIDPSGDPPVGPVLLVPPLGVPARVFDLRRGCSLVEHLVGLGRPTYLVEWGDVSLRDRSLRLDDWVRDALPAAIGDAARDSGRSLHLVGWGLGGLLTLLTAAHRPDLPVASVATLGAPVDVAEVPMVAPLRPLFDPAAGESLPARLYRIGGGAPAAVRWVAELSLVQELVARPLAVAAHLDDGDWLAQVEAVDRLSAQTRAYRGRSYGQLYHRFAQGNALATGSYELAEETVELSAVTAPVLVVAGAADTIAPVESVRAAIPLLTGSAEARLEIVPGGHLGQLTGRAARENTWPALAEWWDEWDGPQGGPPGGSEEGSEGGRPEGARGQGEDGVLLGTGRRRHSSAGSRALRSPGR